MNTLYYIHDPMCSWCWGFRPVWLKARDMLMAQFGDNLQIRYVLGGLASDSNEPMPVATREYVQANWRRIQEVIPGTEFNYDFWQQCQPRRSTYPACRAVIAATIMDSDAELKMIEALQQAYYLRASNPSDEAVLQQCAESIGLDSQQFLTILHSQETQEILEQNLALYRQLSVEAGVGGFPSLALMTTSAALAIPVDYHNPETMVTAIKPLLS
jgi:putative protein-disulfide isomerase